MVGQKDGKPQQSEHISTHFVDRKLPLSVEGINGPIGTDLAIKASCGELSPLLWTEDHHEITCAECNIAILGY